MPNVMTLVRLLLASGPILVGSIGAPTVGWPVSETTQLSATSVAGSSPESDALLAPRFAQTDMDEPLDEPLDEEEELDGPVQRTEDAAGDEPLDAPLGDIESAPVTDDSIAIDLEPLDAPLDAEVVDQPDPKTEILDAPLTDETVAVIPVAEPAVATMPVTKPVAAAVPGAKKVVSEPIASKAKPVTSVRKKGVVPDRVVVVSGRQPLPSLLNDCDVAVGSGRAAVGSDCGTVPVVAGYQPAILRAPGSAALISTENPSVITSRRDGVQIGEYPEPDLGDSIATTVRAAIFPEDVIVPEILIVPGEVTVAGNTSREDPIVLWRSELEAAALETGIPVEMLATAIRATSNGNPLAESPTGGVGLMHVPIGELLARGIREDQWRDPATNIRIGAQLMAVGVSPADVRSGAAVTQYLANSCSAGDACSQNISEQVDEWIVYYRLRATTEGTQPQASAAEIMDDRGWPFVEETGEVAADPLARVPNGNEDSGLPTWSPLSDAPEQDEQPWDWDWPWSPAQEE